MIDVLSKTLRGININGPTFSVFCYADDILLPSLTASGLQTLINVATSYIEWNELCFNSLKTTRVTFGTGTVAPTLTQIGN